MSENPVMAENLKSVRRSRRAFTLVEILVAAGVFAGFLTGVFLLYRMGGQMFTAGSWKLQKQKEAERFLSLLKERLEQASQFSWIQTGSGAGVDDCGTAIGFIKEVSSNTALLSTGKRILLFAVCKPAIDTKAGLVVYQALQARLATGGLLALKYVSTTKSDHPVVVGTPFSVLRGSPDPSLYNQGGSLSEFGLGPNNSEYDLTDVERVTMDCSEADGKNLFGITIEFKHPNDTLFPNTTVSHRVVSQVGIGVTVDEAGLGGL